MPGARYEQEGRYYNIQGELLKEDGAPAVPKDQEVVVGLPVNWAKKWTKGEKIQFAYKKWQLELPYQLSSGQIDSQIQEKLRAELGV